MRAGQIQGTLPYMSPEQASGCVDEIDVRSDVYSLGVILYELMTDRLPFKVTSIAPHEAVRVVCEEPPPRPSSVIRGLRGDLETIILKALEKSPTRRYQSAGEFADDIDRYLTGDPILARPPGTAYQLRKLILRHKLSFSFTAALFVLAFTAAIWVSVLYTHSTREALKTNRINAFLQNMLASFDPYSAAGQKSTVEEVLEEASRRVKTDLTMEPEIEAAIRETIGNTYLNLGHYKEAEGQLLTALQKRQTVLGDHNLDVASSEHNLARLLRLKGDYAYAERMYRDALAVRQSILGREHVEVAASMTGLARVLLDQGRYDEAEKTIRQALRIHTKLLGKQQKEVAADLHCLALVLWAKGDLQESLVQFREALKIRIMTMGDDHPYVAMTLNQLGLLLNDMGQGPRAEELIRKALKMRREKLPPGHPDIAESLISLGKVLVINGKTDEAEKLLRQGLQMRQNFLPPDHWLIAEAKIRLGQCLTAQGRYQQSEPLLVEGLDTMEQVHGQSHKRTIEARDALIHLYELWGKPDQAQPYRQQQTNSPVVKPIAPLVPTP